MSAAIVTGAVARMLELRPLSTAGEIRQCLVDTARRDEDTGPDPSHQWGAGKLVIGAACDAIASLTPLEPVKAPQS